MAAIARVPYVTSHSLQPSRKTETAAMHGIFIGTNTVHRSIRPLTRIWFCISIVSKMSKSELFEKQFVNLSPRSSCDFGETGRACGTTFLLPVKPRRGLADFSTESIVCCLTQHVIWQFCCIIIKIQCCLLWFVAGVMSMCVEIRET